MVGSMCSGRWIVLYGEVVLLELDLVPFEHN
jgi:hypothetical protein